MKKAKRKDKKKSSKEKKKLLKQQLKAQTEPAKTVAAPLAPTAPPDDVDDEQECGPSIDLMHRAKCPESREQWEARQSVIRRVVDPETGRIRLIKGDGEILEEIVTKDRHQQINKDATRADGLNYQRTTVGKYD